MYSTLISGLFGLLGVIIGAVITVFGQYVIDQKKQRKSARYLAIKVSSILESFADECVLVVQDNGIPSGTHPHPEVLVPEVTTPSIDLESLQVDWLSIDKDLAYQILNMPNLLKKAEEMIVFTLDFGAAGPPDYKEYFWERQIQFGEIGAKALEASESLRRINKLPPAEYPDKDWNPIEFLNERKQVALKKKTKEETRQHEAWKSRKEKASTSEGAT